jgi:hypothetical protein
MSIARDLFKKLGVSDKQLVEGAYVDLLALKSPPFQGKPF